MGFIKAMQCTPRHYIWSDVEEAGTENDLRYTFTVRTMGELGLCGGELSHL